MKITKKLTQKFSNVFLGTKKPPSEEKGLSDLVEIRGEQIETPPTTPQQGLTEVESPQNAKEKAELEAFKQIAQPGDVLLCYFKNKKAGVFKYSEWIAFDSPWSHAAMYAGDGFVIHARGKAVVSDTVKGVIKVPVEDFFKNYKVSVFRPTYKDEQAKEKTLTYLNKEIGKKFDVAFDLTTDETVYCSELVYKAILAAYKDETSTRIPTAETLVGILERAKIMGKEIFKMISHEGKEDLEVYQKNLKEKLGNNSSIVDQLPIESALGKYLFTPKSVAYSPFFKKVEVPDDKNYFWSLTKEEMKTPKLIHRLQHLLGRDKYFQEMTAHWGGVSGLIANKISNEHYQPLPN